MQGGRFLVAIGGSFRKKNAPQLEDAFLDYSFDLGTYRKIMIQLGTIPIPYSLFPVPYYMDHLFLGVP